MEFLSHFFDYSYYMPHGHCYLWNPPVLLLHVISDSLIALSYFSIPIGIYYFVKRRKDLKFKSIFYLFSAFILFCGSSHLMLIYTTWVPNYALEGIVKALTAGVSLATAIALWPIIPKALKIPSQQTLDQRNRELKLLNEKLEERVKEQTLEIETQRRYLLDIINVSPVAKFVLNENHEISLVNNRLKDLFKAEEEDILGTKVNQWVPENQRHDHSIHMKHYSEAPDARLMNGRAVRLLNKKKELIDVEISLAPLMQNGKQQVIANLIDISERVRLENQQKKLYQELNTFTSAVNHDLRSPLVTIKGFLQLLKQELLNQDTQKVEHRIDRIETAADRMTQVLDHLKSLKESGSISGKMRWVSPKDILEECQTITGEEISQSKLEVIMDGLPEKIYSDGDKLLHIFQNLITNAIKHNDKSDKKLSISFKHEDNSLRFCDNGNGITEADMKNIFSLYFYNSNNADNSGVGLYLVKRFCEQVEVDLIVESKVDEGTCFQLVFPSSFIQLSHDEGVKH